VLRSVARLFMANTRASDLVARMGGEEFLIVLVGTPLAAAHDICERIRLAVAGHAWGRIADKLKVTISIGLTESVGDGAGTLDAGALLSQADALLYAAKHAGRNRVSTAVDGPA
jgi:diguanylate cyclase